MEDIEYELIDLDWNLEYVFEEQGKGSMIKDDSDILESSNKQIEFKTDENHIPLGSTKEEIKIREKFIKNFYAQWIEKNPSKKVWNEYLQAYIHVKFASINETFAKAARTYESTCAVFLLDDILKTAIKISETSAKNNKNQKAYEKMLLMTALDKVQLTVGLQKSTQEYVQYCITSPSGNEKMPTEKR